MVFVTVFLGGTAENLPEYTGYVGIVIESCFSGQIYKLPVCCDQKLSQMPAPAAKKILSDGGAYRLSELDLEVSPGHRYVGKQSPDSQRLGVIIVYPLYDLLYIRV